MSMAVPDETDPLAILSDSGEVGRICVRHGDIVLIFSNGRHCSVDTVHLRYDGRLGWTWSSWEPEVSISDLVMREKVRDALRAFLRTKE